MWCEQQRQREQTPFAGKCKMSPAAESVLAKKKLLEKTFTFSIFLFLPNRGLLLTLPTVKGTRVVQLTTLHFYTIEEEHLKTCLI